MATVLSVATVSINQEQNLSNSLAHKSWRRMEKSSCVSGGKKGKKKKRMLVSKTHHHFKTQHTLLLANQLQGFQV